MDPQTIDTYNKKAKEYDDETVEFWAQFPRTYIDTFVAQSGPVVLDLGSGPGRDGLLLKEAGKEVICLDASEAMVTLCRQRGLTTVQGDFLALPFDDGAFDAVWAYTALLHIPKLSMGVALGEMQRVVRTNGYVAIGLIEGEGEEYRTSSGVASSRLFSYYQKEEMVALCASYGFLLVYFDSFKPRSRTYLHFLFQFRP